MGQNRLSWLQFTLLIYKTQIGVRILSASRILINDVETDGWILLMICCGIAILTSIWIYHVMRLHPNETLFDLSERYLGKWLGKGVSLVWIVYGWIVSTYVLFMTIHLINIWILPNTRFYLLMLLLLVPIYMIANRGIQLMGRFAEFVFLSAFFMPVLVLFALQDAEWQNLLPVLKDGWEPIFRHLPIGLPFFAGFELSFFWYPYIKEKEKALRGIILANLLTLYILLVVTIVSFVKFSPLEIKQLVWPTVSLLKFIQFPFLERLEVIVLSIYIYVLLATVIPYLFVALLGIRRLFGMQKRPRTGKVALILILALWFLIACFAFPTFVDLLHVTPLIEQVGFFICYYFTIAFGIIVFLAYWWKKVRNS